MKEWIAALLDLGGLVAPVLGLYGIGTLLHQFIGHFATAASLGVMSLVIGVALLDLLDRTARFLRGYSPPRRAVPTTRRAMKSELGAEVGASRRG